MQAKQIRQAQLRAAGQDRTYEFTITTEAVDSYGTVFKADGWDMSRYMENPIVAYNHQTHSGNPDHIIGTSTLRREGNDWIATLTLEPEGTNEIADKVARKLDAGTIKGASVGAMVHQYHRGDKTKGEDPEVIYFDRSELAEWSVVTIPANKEALKRNEDGLEEIRMELFKPTISDETLKLQAERAKVTKLHK